MSATANKKEAEKKINAAKSYPVRIKDPASALTHFIGFVAAAASAPFILSKFIRSGAGAGPVVSCAVFVLGMLLLYGASTTYHSVCTDDPEIQKNLKKFDHMMIFMLIAGTYTPICTTILWDSCGKWMLALIWGLAATGILFKFFWVTCPKWVSTVIYVTMGWVCIFALPSILKTMAPAGFGFLLAGGISYTIGGVIYALKFKKLNTISKYFGSHEIFHVFVLAGTILQFITVYDFLV